MIDQRLTLFHSDLICFFIAGGAVCGALGYGMFQFLQGKDSRAANRAMLWRVGLQAGGVIALIAIVNIWEGPMVQGWLHANDPPKYEDPDVPHPRRY